MADEFHGHIRFIGKQSDKKVESAIVSFALGIANTKTSHYFYVLQFFNVKGR